MLKKFQFLYSFAFVATFATFVAETYSTNCVGLVHEPEIPQELVK